jgi:hypothetical protein
LDKSIAYWIVENCKHNWRFYLGVKQSADRLWASRNDDGKIALKIGGVLPQAV